MSEIDSIMRQICIQLRLDPDHPPLNLETEQTAEILGVKPKTLGCWASTGRYNLPFTKAGGRSRRYPLRTTAEFIVSRTMTHTGQGVAA